MLLQVEQNSDNTYREAAAKVIADSLRCCLSDDNTALQTRKALLLLGGHFSFSGDLLAEDWMLTHAGFIDDSRATPVDSDAIVQVPHACTSTRTRTELLLTDSLFLICTRTRKRQDTRPGWGE